MQIQDVRSPVHETLETLHESEEGCLVAARTAAGEEILLFVPATLEAGGLERDRLELLHGPGVPRPGAPRGEPGESIVLAGAAGARPLRSAPPLPHTVWRPGLARLLSALSQAHGRGWIHGRLHRGFILVDPSGEFWIHGWAASRPAVGRGPFQAGLDDVSAELRDLGAAFVAQFADAPAETLEPAAVAPALARIAAFDRELARVLGRLVTADPREAYESATDVLTDLGERDESLPDAWLDLPLVGRGPLVRSVVARAERAATRHARLASYEIVGPPGSGRSRVLAEVARAARERELVVLQASGGAPDHPWGALASLARQLLSRLAPAHPLRGDRGVRALLGDVPAAATGEAPAAADGASVALADLMAEALRGSRAVVLLDDEDAMPGHAQRAWLSLGRHIAAAADSAEAIPALLVAASARGAPEELGVPRERAELADLRPRHVVHLVASLLSERGNAAILAAELVAVAGGRPGDIVDHLLDLRHRGALVPVGRRWHVADPSQTVRAGSATDRLRRSMDAAGRDAIALAETVAVSARLRLPREVVAQIAELTGPALHAAAEAALRAGLLRRDGATWRARTETVRARLESAMPDDRRRGLHREVLAHLLDAPDADWPAIAHHGRAAGDARAAGWTRRALEVLRCAGRFDEAATQFDEARTLLDPASLDIPLRLVHVDTLLNAGRLDDATRCADEISRDPLAAPDQRGHAVLALARLHRYDQAWSKVLALDLPVDCDDPVVLARIRLLRAVAYVATGRPGLADREARLADAEHPSPFAEPRPLELAYSIAEYRAERAMWSLEVDSARGALLAALRLARRIGNQLFVVLDLIRFANAARLRDERKLSRAVLARALTKCETQLARNPLVLAWIASTTAYCDLDENRPARQVHRLESAALYAARTGAPTLQLNKRIELACAHARAGTMPFNTYHWVRSLAQDLTQLPPDTLSISAARISECLVYCGFLVAQRALDQLVEALRTTDWVRAQVHANTMRLELYLDFDRVTGASGAHDQTSLVIQRFMDLCSANGCHATPVEHAFSGGTSPTQVALAYVAFAVRRGWVFRDDWPDSLSPAKLVTACERAKPSNASAADLVCSLILAPTGALTSEETHRLELILNREPPGRPTPMEWRRTLANSRLMWGRLQNRTALRLARRAIDQIAVLNRSESGDVGPRAASLATELLEAQGIRLAQPTNDHRRVRTGTQFVEPEQRAPDWLDWGDALNRALSTHRCLVTSRFERELLAFMAELQKRSGPVHTMSHGVARVPGARGRVFIVLTSDMSAEDVRRAASAVRLTTSDDSGLVVGIVGDSDAGQHASAAHASVVEAASGVRIAVPSACLEPGRRRSLFRHLVGARVGDRVELDESVAATVESYSWPGGLAEMENVAREVRVDAERRITMERWMELGIAPAAFDAWTRVANPLEPIIESTVKARPGLSTSEIARSTSRPLRTIVRIVGSMCGRGILRRVGIGRASRYWCARTERASRDDGGCRE